MLGKVKLWRRKRKWKIILIPMENNPCSLEGIFLVTVRKYCCHDVPGVFSG